jgi:hypothetical protein
MAVNNRRANGWLPGKRQGETILSSRLHALFYGYLLLLGLMYLTGAVFGEPKVTRVVLGVVYIAAAAYQLSDGYRSAAPVFAVQRVD